MREERIIVGEGSKYPLDGILTLPDELDKKVPAVVFVHGSGASNMDEKVGKLTPFKDIAEGLAKQGIASLRYNKRSYSYGFKMLREKNVTVKVETIEDAVMAADLLREDSRIDTDNIYIVGHSMGAMLAPRIDAEGGNFKGLILMAGSPRTLEKIMMDQNQMVLGQVKGITRAIVKKQVATLTDLFENLYEITDEEAKSKKVGGGTTLYYFKEMGEHPASMYLENLEKPILVLQGEKDFQATVEKDFEGYKHLLGEKENVTFQLYEGLNHAFVPSVYGNIMKAKQEYNVEQRVSEKVIIDIASWIHEQ